MYVPDESHTFSWPVTIRVPAGVTPDGDPRYEHHDIVVEYRAMAIDHAYALLAAPANDPAAPPLLEQAVVGWEGIGVERDGAVVALEFSVDALRRLIRIGYVASALLDAYLAALTGRRSKNS